MIQFHSLGDKGLVLIKRAGKVTVDEIMKHIKCLDAKLCHLEKIYILEKFGNSISVFKSRSDLEMLNKEISNRIVEYKTIKHAFLIQRPVETARAILFQEAVCGINNYQVEIFSTEKAAVAWLKSC